jgi:hypothetical protein
MEEFESITDTAGSESGRQDGQRLKQILQARGISVNDFAQHYIKKSVAMTYVLLRKPEFSTEEMAAVCYLCSLDATDFDLPIDWMRTPLNENRLQDQYNSVAAFHAFDHSEGPQIAEFAADYFNTLSHYSTQANNELRVYQYVGKLRKHVEEYAGDQYDLLYKAIFDHWQATPELIYQRFITLPIEHAKPGQALEETLKSILELQVPATVFHQAKCLRNNAPRFSLFAVSVPVRLNSFTLVDQRYAISEYDRINRYGKMTHNLMFVDKIHNNIPDVLTGLWKTYTADLNALSFDSDLLIRRHVTWEKYLEVLFKAHGDAETALVESQKLYDATRKTFEPSVIAPKDYSAKVSELSEARLRNEAAEQSFKEWSEKLQLILPLL